MAIIVLLAASAAVAAAAENGGGGAGRETEWSSSAKKNGLRGYMQFYLFGDFCDAILGFLGFFLLGGAPVCL